MGVAHLLLARAIDISLTKDAGDIQNHGNPLELLDCHPVEQVGRGSWKVLLQQRIASQQQQQHHHHEKMSGCPCLIWPCNSRISPWSRRRLLIIHVCRRRVHVSTRCEPTSTTNVVFCAHQCYDCWCRPGHAVCAQLTPTCRRADH